MNTKLIAMTCTAMAALALAACGNNEETPAATDAGMEASTMAPETGGAMSADGSTGGSTGSSGSASSGSTGGTSGSMSGGSTSGSMSGSMSGGSTGTPPTGSTGQGTTDNNQVQGGPVAPGTPPGVEGNATSTGPRNPETGR